MQDEALKHFRTSSGWKVGVDGSVAFIDVGKGKSLDTINIKDPIVAFLFGQKGLMASATICANIVIDWPTDDREG